MKRIKGILNDIINWQTVGLVRSCSFQNLVLLGDKEHRFFLLTVVEVVNFSFVVTYV